MDQLDVRIRDVRRRTTKKNVLREIMEDATRGTRRYLRVWTAGRGGE